ncbi:PucR family transcriptional regulator [Paenibacillus wenxiniae]|uniref:PucR family transcriptional regulator n=1 Tax=Paenibacillus wenxiniae TaxID=1636843 RepID=A0ABW4RKX6_9BACL
MSVRETLGQAESSAEWPTIMHDQVMIPVWQGNGRVVVWEPSIPVALSSSSFSSTEYSSTGSSSAEYLSVVSSPEYDSSIDHSLNEHADPIEVAHDRGIGEEELYRLYQLLELLLPSVTGMQPIVMATPVSGPEQEARELGQWLVRQLSLRSLSSDIPEDMAIRRRLHRAMVPFVLLADSLPSGTLHPKQLGKLLSSYFDRTVLLIPLQENEWLILANHGLIEDEDHGEQQQLVSSSKSRHSSIEEKSSKSSRTSGSHHSKEARESSRDSWDGNGEGEDTEEDLLTAFALGLHELVASEWVGSFHISVGLPLHPLHELAQTVSQLRETIHLGRLFHVTEHIHLPWELRLESLLYRIPEEERLRFVEAADRYAQLFDDAETVATLETFFKMDCNVSETAKQLYIHRNTLLYRLDRIKQDTQLDVRRFEDAVLMRLTLLLYKVTKS